MGMSSMNPPNEEQAAHCKDGHFVFIYHEAGQSGRPVYVGYGRRARDQRRNANFT